MEHTTRILLVEDDAIIALAESAMLGDVGFAVEVAHTGEEAVERVARGDTLDLVLMDIDLGRGIDGTEAATRILDVRAIPIVFLTSHSEKEMVDRVKGITRYGYVLKNSGRFVLIESVTMALELFRAHEVTAARERRIRDLNRTYDVLTAINQEILRATDPAALFTAACRIAVERGSFLFAWVGTVDATGSTIVPATSYGDHAPYLESLYLDLKSPTVAPGPTATCVRTAAHVIVNDIANTDAMGPWKELAASHGFRSSAAFPIVVDGEVYGIFGIYAGSTGFFDDEEVSLLDQLAADLGYALEVARTRDAAAAAERARAEWEHLMSFVIEHDPSSIAVYDTEMRYLYVSNKFLNDNGLQKELVIGRRHYDVLPDIPRKWREAHRRALAGEKVHSEDDFYVRADGTVEYNRWDCRPWRRRDGEIGGIILYTEVITRQRLAEGEHRRVLAALRSLLEHSPDLISIVDADGHWVMVSDSVAEVTGVTADEMEGRRFEELIDEGVAARFRARIRKIVEGRHSISELEEIETPEGTRRFRTTLFPAEQAGGAVRLIGIVSTDLTAETRALEDRREAEIAREQVLAQRELTLRESHHRIKNDMQIIEALLSLQAGETADPAAAEVLEEAAGRVEVMTQLYDTIYLHGDPESDTDLAELIPALVHGIGRRYGRRAPDITAEAASISVPNRQAGPIAVIVNELITNAVKHGSSHRPDDLAIRVRVLAEDGTTVVRVSDNGPGIDQDVLAGHSDGFGMTLVRTFAAQLRGSVAMRNNADSGATVDVRF